MPNTLKKSKIQFAVLATDTALFTIRDQELHVRLMNVHRPPFFNNIAGLPGGLILPYETAEQAAERVVTEKSGVNAKKAYLEQLYTFSRVDRDPRGRVVAVGYIGLIPWESLSTHEREDSKELWWQRVDKIPKLAYDHHEILRMAIDRLKARIGYTTIASKLLPKEFTLTDLEHVYAAILSRTLDRRNFRKKIQTLGLLKPLNRERRGQKWRPAKLYQFKSPNIQMIEIL